MARLYNGFDALRLGQAINAMHNANADRNITALNAIAQSVGDFVREREAANEKRQQRQSAMDFLTGNGMDREKAESLVNTGVAPGELAMYMTGRIDKKADTEDERAYAAGVRKEGYDRADFEYGRNRADTLKDREDQWAHDLDVWMRQNGITHNQAVKLAQFGALMNERAAIAAKDWGNSRAGVEKYNSVTKALEDFTSRNPEFANVYGMLSNNGVQDSGAGFYDEDITDRLKALGDKSVTDEQREEYLKELQKANKLTYVQSNPELFKDALTIFAANADNKKLSPYLNLERVIGGATTAPQRKREQEDAAFANKVASIKSKLESEAGKPWGEGKLPEGIDERVKKELKKDKTAWSRYQKLGGS